MLLAIAVIATACTSGARGIGTQPSWRGKTAKATGVVTFAPTSEPARNYNEPAQPPPHTPLGDALIAAIKEAAVKANVPVPVADARLFRACAELAEVVPSDGAVSYSVIEFALQRHGIIEPSPRNLIVWGNGDPVEIFHQQFKAHLAELLADGSIARIGIGAAKRTADGDIAVVLSLQESAVTTAPIPRMVAAGGSFMLDATVEARYHDPELFMTREDGRIERIAFDSAHGAAFKATIGCGKHQGRQQIEIAANGSSGSTVLANFPVWCGTEPPLSITIDPTASDVIVSAEDAERRLLALMNHDREAAGLPGLVWDDRVAAVARAYSEEMRRTKLVAHISPTSGSAADRVHAASIKTALVLENIARAYGINEAHTGLMNSPGHRANVLASQATHVGVGVVLGDEVSGRREMFLTQVFIRVPPKVDARDAADFVRKRIDAVRPVVVNAKLQTVAQELADGLAAGKSRDQLWPGVRKKLDQTAYARVSSVVSAVSDLESIDGKQLVGDYKPDDIGVGIAQGNHPEIGEGAIWVVVLIAERLPAKRDH